MELGLSLVPTKAGETKFNKHGNWTGYERQGLAIIKQMNPVRMQIVKNKKYNIKVSIMAKLKKYISNKFRGMFA